MAKTEITIVNPPREHPDLPGEKEFVEKIVVTVDTTNNQIVEIKGVYND